MTTIERFTFFWHGPFSQWHQSKFVIDGVTFSNAEQYMMRSKAVLFGDLEAARSIMGQNDPKIIKALGRAVRGFDHETWENHCRDVVRDGNRAKFTQNAILGDKLRMTDGTTLVEASPYDRIWGIGLSERDPRSKERHLWLGENRLGEILTSLRIELFGS